jgi:hypothetical protein
MIDAVPPPPRSPLLPRLILMLLAFAAGAALVHLIERSGPVAGSAGGPAGGPAGGSPPPVAANGPSSTPGDPALPSPAPAVPHPGKPSTGASSDEAATTIAVAKVNGEDVSLRDLEDALLKKEGAEQVEEAVHKLLDLTNWSKLHDDDLIVATAFGQVKRRQIAIHLLNEKAGPVREELINIALVEQALRHEGVVIDDAAKEAEVARMEKRLHEGLEKRKQPVMDLRTFIQQSEKTSLENFILQPGFKMLAGLHVLVQKQARIEVKDPELQAYFDEHIERYRTAEAVDISDIFIPYLAERNQEGVEVISENEKAQRQQVASSLYNMIRRNQLSFEKTFAGFAKNADQDADAGGRVGWVTRDGLRGKRGSRRIPARVVDEAFQAQGPFPALLSPVIHDLGVDIIRVHARRAGQEAVLGLMRERVLTDLVDAEIDPRTKRLLDGLRRASTIIYGSLPSIIKERAQIAGEAAQTDPGRPAAAPAEAAK